MKMYTIPKGTDACVMIEEGCEGIRSKSHITTKELTFFDTVMDPIRIHNQNTVSRLHNKKIYCDLAHVGYAVFRDLDNPKYTIAVEYKLVEVS